MSGIHQIIDRQIRRWEVESRARKERAAERPGKPAPVLPCVTISREFGSGGEEIAERLSSKLTYPIVDKEILDVLVREEHLRAALVEALDERDRSWLDVWVEGILRGNLQDKDDYLHSLVRVIGGIAMHGHSIIIGHGANFILDSHRTLNVRIVAPRAERIQEIMRTESMEDPEAAKLVDRIDAERIAYVRHYFHGEIADPLAYDLLINTSRIGPDLAVELIERAFREKLSTLPNVHF